ncbi:hypothetical protein D3C85_853740 [compost metagenome]
MARRQRSAIDVQLRPINRPRRPVQPQAGLGIVLVLPGLQRTQHLGGESLVDFVEVELLQAEPQLGQHPRHGIGGRHQEPLIAVDEVHRRRLSGAEVGQNRQTARPGPVLAGQQHGRGAVTQGGGVGRRQGAVRPVEHRLHRRQLGRVDVGPQVVVALLPPEGRDLTVKQPGLPGGGGVAVAGDGQGVLILARDAPALGHQLAVLAHRQAGARLGVARRLGPEGGGQAGAGQGLQTTEIGLLAVGGQQGLAEAVVQGDRRVRGGVHPARDPDLDLAQGDLVGDENGRLQPGAAGLLHVIGRGVVADGGVQQALAGQGDVARQLQHRPRRHLAQPQAVQVETVGQALQGGGQHLLIGGLGIGGVRPREGDAIAAEDSDATRRGRGQHEEPSERRVSRPRRWARPPVASRTSKSRRSPAGPA